MDDKWAQRRAKRRAAGPPPPRNPSPAESEPDRRPLDDLRGLGKRTRAMIAQVNASVIAAQQTWPDPPRSGLRDHPELRGERYDLAERYWAAGMPEKALPLYEQILLEHEAVLAADDVSTLEIRQRVGEAYLTLGLRAQASALLAQTHAHLKRVKGPGHPDTSRASDALHQVRRQFGELGLPADEAAALEDDLSQLTRTVGADHPTTLRTACALGNVLAYSLKVMALDVLTETLGRAERVLGPNHPDTDHVRNSVIDVCEFAEHSGDADEIRAAVKAREQVHGPDGRETLAAMRRLAEKLGARRRGRGEARDLLQEVLARCERGVGPADPLTVEVRDQLAKLK